MAVLRNPILVSVPLSGIVSYTDVKNDLQKFAEIVSVPLSGIVSYTNKFDNDVEKVKKVSVPLSGIVSYTINRQFECFDCSPSFRPLIGDCFLY